MEEEARKSVELCKNLSIALAEVYEANRLPTQNFYMFSKELMQRDWELSKRDDYLILLTALCCQNNHLMKTWDITVARRRNEVKTPLKLYKSCEPERYNELINELGWFESFCRYAGLSSIICYQRFKAIVSEWKTYKQIIPVHFKWRGVYEKAVRQKHPNLYGVANNEAMETPSWEFVYDVLKIFEEYICNLSRDSKNKSKYKKPLNAIRKCIKEMEDKFYEIEEDKIDETLSDKIEQRISKILSYATQYEPYSLIGPLYVCWILEKRIFKIVAPSKRMVGFTLNEKDPFPVNEQHHIHKLTIADQAKIYLFDALCGVWEKWNLGNTSLSQFLFERTMPLYSDFMKFDSAIDRNLETYETPNSKHVTHKFCHYPIGEYTNLFLQRASKDLSESLMVAPNLFPYGMRVTDQEWCRYIRDNKDDPPSADLYFQYSRKHFILVFKTDKKLLFVIKVLQQQTFEYAQTVVDQFERLFYLDSQGLGTYCTDESRRDTVLDFFKEAYVRIWSSVLLQLKEKFAGDFEKYIERLQENIVEEDIANYVIDALIMICAREIYRKYFEQIMCYSRKARFRIYSDAQYNRLFSFLESCNISLCDQK